MLQNDASSEYDELAYYLRAANIQWSGVDLSDVKQMWISPREREQLALLEGDLLVSEGGDVGRSAIWGGELDVCYFQNSVNRVRAHIGNSTRFLYYWLSTIKGIGFIDIICNKSTIAHFTAEKVAAVPVALPFPEEQSTIAAFLDHETAQIDTLIAEQQKLIALLKEKRQAVIAHAVTKGLDPTVPMKDSGVEWLGEVPEHWKILAARRILMKIEQGWTPESFNRPAENDEWGVLKSGCVNRGIFNESENKALPPKLEIIEEYEVSQGDVLMSRASGSPELIGSVAFVEQTRPRLTLSDKTFRFRFAKGLLPRFFVSLFNSLPLRTQIERSISGAEGLANNLAQSSIKTFRITLPPMAEQLSIVAFLDNETSKIDELTTEAQRGIELLKERRSALISAAVTGKIDVRGWTPPEAV
jgi:type I restriction enzyme S subunit